MGVWIDERIERIAAGKILGIKALLSAYNSILSPLAYVSMPITGGIRLYEALDKYGVKSAVELKQKNSDIFFQEVIDPNTREGIALAERVAERTNFSVVVPALFEARDQGWLQDEYMYLWLRLIEDKVEELHMAENWQYSSGSAEEFTRGVEMQFNFCKRRNILIFDHQGKEIGINEGTLLLVDAIENVAGRGHNPEALFVFVDKLTSVAGFYMSSFTFRKEWLAGMEPFMSRSEWWSNPDDYPFNWGKIKKAFEKAKKIVKEYK